VTLLAGRPPTLLARLRDEMSLWRMAWQHIETFIDRIDETRQKDQIHAAATQALIQAAAALEYERKLRDGTGLDQPLEIALDPSDVAGVLLAGNATNRLPGAYDLDIAVAMMLAKPSADGKSLMPLQFATVCAQTTLFERFDEEGVLETLTLPSYDFAWGADVNVDISDPHSNLFSYPIRIQAVAVQGGPPVAGTSAPYAWSAFRDLRALNLDTTDSVSAKLTVLQTGGAASSADVSRALRNLAAACTAGSNALTAAAPSIAGASITLSDKDLTGAAADMLTRGQSYSAAADALDSAGSTSDLSNEIGRALALVSGTPVSTSGQSTAALYSLTGTSMIASGKIDGALDDAVEARIAYPDGTLRMLRTMEWALVRMWPVRVAWFAARRKRYLCPLLVDRFLETFLASLASIVQGAPPAASLPSGVGIDPDRPAALGSNYVQLAPRAGQPWGLGGLVDAQGQVAWVEGPRRALLVILGDGSPKIGAAPQRLQITPLRVSTAKTPPPPGSTASTKLPRDTPGMLASGTIEAGPVPVSHDDLKTGTVAGRPQDEGLPQAVVALWSRLCLLFGTEKVEVRLTANAPASGAPGHVPSFLPLKTRLPIGLGAAADPGSPALSPHDTKIVITVDALVKAGLDPDAVPAPVIARPGELLLVQGTDANGYTWQGVVEVTSIVRTTPDHIGDNPLVPTLGTQVCCNQPGTVIVMQVLDVAIPAPLVTAFLHRSFQGFGAPSLATGVLLPNAIDPAEIDPASQSNVDRGPELTAACNVLSSWMWPPL
jgi:hypothetical protein